MSTIIYESISIETDANILQDFHKIKILVVMERRAVAKYPGA